VPTEQAIRAFLLGMSDPQTEATIEQGVLDGSILTDDLWMIEEELVDDHVFGRLSPEQETAFHRSFLTSAERKDKLSFSRALHKYAQEHASAAPARRRFFFGMNYRFALATGFALLGLVAATAAWFGIRDARLTRQLAQVTTAANEQQRLVASLIEEQKQRATQTNPAAAPPAPSTPASNPSPEPGIQLRPGVRRGVESIPVLHIAGQPTVVRITLELAFQPAAGLREELLRANGQQIWSQELTPAAPLASHGATVIYLPAQLLTPGDYQLRLKDLSAGPTDEGDVYAFRVTRP
jgi:hypothetical protein